MAKYRAITKHGELEVGQNLFKKDKEGHFGSPWTIRSLYLQDGTGIKAVQKCKTTDQIVYGSRIAVPANGNVIQEYQIPALQLKDFYVKIEEEEDATPAVV